MDLQSRIKTTLFSEPTTLIVTFIIVVIVILFFCRTVGHLDASPEKNHLKLKEIIIFRGYFK
jgi:hypothetical protein